MFAQVLHALDVQLREPMSSRRKEVETTIDSGVVDLGVKVDFSSEVLTVLFFEVGNQRLPAGPVVEIACETWGVNDVDVERYIVLCQYDRSALHRDRRVDPLGRSGILFRVDVGEEE